MECLVNCLSESLFFHKCCFNFGVSCESDLHLLERLIYLLSGMELSGTELSHIWVSILCKSRASEKGSSLGHVPLCLPFLHPSLMTLDHLICLAFPPTENCIAQIGIWPKAFSVDLLSEPCHIQSHFHFLFVTAMSSWECDVSVVLHFVGLVVALNGSSEVGQKGVNCKMSEFTVQRAEGESKPILCPNAWHAALRRIGWQ